VTVSVCKGIAFQSRDCSRDVHTGSTSGIAGFLVLPACCILLFVHMILSRRPEAQQTHLLPEVRYAGV
jgi:hypothetical protein